MFETKTIADNIYEDLRASILHLKYTPGERLSKDNLVKKYNVSWAPIRDAIRKLQQDKLLVVKAQSGTIVAPVFLDRAVKICEVRLLLEPYAAEVAARKISSEELSLLKSQFDKLKTSSAKKSNECIFETDKILHKTILRLCGNEEIETILDRYSDEINRVRLSTIRLADRVVPLQKEIKKIYKALKEKDPKEANAQMFAHILNFKNALEFVLRLNEGEK